MAHRHVPITHPGGLWGSLGGGFARRQAHTVTTDVRGRDEGMVFRFDKTAENVLAVCMDCGGTWRDGPYRSESDAWVAARKHTETAHTENRRTLLAQLAAKERRAARRG